MSKYGSLNDCFLGLVLFVFMLTGPNTTYSQDSVPVTNHTTRSGVFILQNEHIRLAVQVQRNTLLSETIDALKGQKAFFNGSLPSLSTDGDFALDIMWTDWQAPGMKNNAENPVLFTKKDFSFIRAKKISQKGLQELFVDFAGKHTSLLLSVVYRLGRHDFFIKKQIVVRDTLYGYHFLRQVYPQNSVLKGRFKHIKAGGFGQPVALENEKGGYFFGLEYPAARNTVEVINGVSQVACRVEVGKKIGVMPIESGWSVMALTPPRLQKLWFSKYLKDIRVQPLAPYTLYNSWYDLRSAAYANIAKSNVMNEKNVLRIIDLIRKNFVQKNNIHLDAFVLDDGWDVHKSDWQLDKRYFPNGLKTVRNKLASLHTKLGIWFGPVGGYDFRNERIDWMARRGYEVVGRDVANHNRMLCLAGKRYSQLFKKRTTDFVNKEGVRFFKWDGIQFSCSEAGHGHPIGIYSRRAVLDSLLGLVKAVRAQHPDVYLNITSGTWLSPWWVQYANQIWMSGGDYGYSDVPSVSRRDAAMTYRDIVLYQDFKVNDFWMPIANLMTHGIIKGNLQMLGAKEPIDKFTNNALLYFARGVSMWELYISPDILTANEWSAISKSLHWARANFDILKHTEMVGGNPGERAAYGYVHFNGNKGILAIRNPFIEKKELKIILSEKYNLNPQANNLVLERVYPTRWIDPQLYRAGDRLTLPLDGFETAVYQLYPLSEAQEPLLAGVVFESRVEGSHTTIRVMRTVGQTRLLNPQLVQSVRVNDKPVNPEFLTVKTVKKSKFVKETRFDMVSPQTLQARFTVPKNGAQTHFLLLLEQEAAVTGTVLPQATIMCGGQKLEAQVEKQEGRWTWYSVAVSDGAVALDIRLQTKGKLWQGKASGWVTAWQQTAGQTLVLKTKKKLSPRILPPRPWPEGGVIHITAKLGELTLRLR